MADEEKSAAGIDEELVRIEHEGIGGAGVDVRGIVPEPKLAEGDVTASNFPVVSEEVASIDDGHGGVVASVASDPNGLGGNIYSRDEEFLRLVFAF